MKEDKKRLFASIISMVVLITIISLAAYAYFPAYIEVGETPVSITGFTASNYTFTAFSEDTLVLNLNSEDMEASGTQIVGDMPVESAIYYKDLSVSDSAYVDVYLSAGSEGELTFCSYDLIWEWKSENRYTEPSMPLFEYVYVDNYGELCSPAAVPRSTRSSSCTFAGEFESELEVSLSVDGYQYSSYDLTEYGYYTDNSVYLGSFDIATDSVDGAYQYVNISTYLYNLPVRQYQFETPMEAVIKVANVSCSTATAEPSLAIEPGLTLNDGIKGISGTNYYAQNSELAMWAVEYENGGYRYEGRNPNNYICFDESCSDGRFRIVGLFDSTAHGQDMELVKIMASSSATYAKWNSTKIGTNYSDWTTSTLNSYLNTTYYESLSDNLKGYIKNVDWYIGNSYYYNTAETIFNSERDERYLPFGNVLQYTSNIGLISRSDYGYSSLTVMNCTRFAPVISPYTHCSTQSWIPNGWTISPFSTSSAYVVYSSGMSYYSVTGYRYTYPAMYIPSDLIVVSGDGTYSTPYIVNGN